ncbi:MAG: pyridoxal phosphate-dependent aminotransferase [Spirochaetota bacterium]
MSAPIPHDMVSNALRELRIGDPGRASIREIRRLVDLLEERSGVRFIRMEMGVPGLPTPSVAIEAETDALHAGVTAIYPPAAGIPDLKREISRFARLFLNTKIDPSGCIPTVGSLGASFLSFLVLGTMREGADTILLVDPGFPVHRQQATALGLAVRGFDLADHRGDRLREELDRLMADGRVAAVLYSNPNNPSWMCLTRNELETIAAACRDHGAVPVEDLAYFAMDFREDFGRPGTPPYQPSVAEYTDEYLLLISSSKIFSYAGQRIGMLLVSDALAERECEPLARRFPYTRFGDALVLGAVYAASAGVTHTAQHGLAALLRSANDGLHSFRDDLRSYRDRAERMKRLFVDHGFSLVYDTDVDRPIGDGFYFTLTFEGLGSAGLVAELIPYGISAISLAGVGAAREGIRACVSLVRDDQLPELGRRLDAFRTDHDRASRES